MSTSRWYIEAHRVARLVIESRKPNESDDQIRDRVQAAYPFGQRAYLPYKWWCKVVMELYKEHGLLTPRQQTVLDRRMEKVRIADDGMRQELLTNPLFQRRP